MAPHIIQLADAFVQSDVPRQFEVECLEDSRTQGRESNPAQSKNLKIKKISSISCFNGLHVCDVMLSSARTSTRNKILQKKRRLKLFKSKD